MTPRHSCTKQLPGTRQCHLGEVRVCELCGRRFKLVMEHGIRRWERQERSTA